MTYATLTDVVDARCALPFQRLRDMQQSEAGRAKDDARRRDQKREERELAKVQELAAAAAAASAAASTAYVSSWPEGLTEQQQRDGLTRCACSEKAAIPREER